MIIMTALKTFMFELLKERLKMCQGIIGTHWEGRAIGLGDVILVTATVREIKKRVLDYPLTVLVPSHPEVFDNNPEITKVIIGAGNINTEGDNQGHYIYRMCKWFGIESPELKGELFLTLKEVSKAFSLLKSEKPIVILHIGDPTLISPEVFFSIPDDSAEFIQVDTDTYRELQVPAIPKANQQFRKEGVRELMAIISLCEIFIGVNSGPMHIAACFDKPAIIYNVHNPDFLYPQNVNATNIENFSKRVIEWKQLVS